MERRAFLLGLVASTAVLLSSPPLGVGVATAQTKAGFRAIVVDTKPLEARGGRGAAAILRPQLQASLEKEFAGLLGRSGPVLVVRIQTVSLGGFAGVGGGGVRGHSATDYLEGDVSIGKRSFPLLISQSSSAGGAWYLPDNDARRLRALAVQFAGWVRRKV